MSKVRNLYAKYWRNVHLSAIVILSVVFIFTQNYISPYLQQSVETVFYSPFSKLELYLSKLVYEAEDNQQLRESLVESAVKLTLYEEALKENNRLRGILGFEYSPDYELIPSEVISVSGEFMPVRAMINKGTKDSIEVNLPVVNKDGLIGRISSVSEDYAVVQLLTEPTNRVAARTSDSREMGIVKYSNSEGMILENFPIQGIVNVNDSIVSSGLGGIYPEGLFVGIVESVERRELSAFCDIKIKPAVNFYSIEELFILKEVEF